MSSLRNFPMRPRADTRPSNSQIRSVDRSQLNPPRPAFPGRREGGGELARAVQGESSILRLAIPPGLPFLEDALEFVGAYAKKRFMGRTAERVRLAGYELLNNALDYGRVTLDVIFELSATEDEVIVSVTNGIAPARLDMLRKQLERLSADASGTYSAEMTRSLGGGPRAMLGLARILHEAGMQLDHRVDGEQVTVSARCRR